MGRWMDEYMNELMDHQMTREVIVREERGENRERREALYKER